MATSNIYIQLPNGKKLPLLGLGTWQSKRGEVQRAIEIAIDCGYRHIDAAFVYGNEKDVGAGIKAKIDDGTITRENVFVTTKLWSTANHPNDVEANCRQSLSKLGLDYVDLYLMHWPFALTKEKGKFPLGEDGFMIGNDDVDYVDTWKAMEPLVDKGLVRAIGISNFTEAQIQRVLDLPPKHPISNLQIESHPFLAQTKLLGFCTKHGITVTAFSPLGSPARPGEPHPDDPVLLEDPVVCGIAKKRGVTPAQVLLRYHLQRGVAVIPKSVTPSRIQQNFKSLNFKLSDEEFRQLQGLDKHHRLLTFDMASRLKHYPFKSSL